MMCVLFFFGGGNAVQHDAQFDHYGKRLATASSDHTVNVFEVGTDSARKVAELRKHEGPVWQVAWAHPRFGSVLASCSYDRRVLVWQEGPQGWRVSHEVREHTRSVNSVAFAPHEYGLVLASGSSDGTVVVSTWLEGDRWQHDKVDLEAGGVNAVSWAPAIAPMSLLRAPVATPNAPGAAAAGSAAAPRQFAAACCDGTIRIVAQDEHTKAWRQTAALESGHSDWVRDVAWAPAIGAAVSTLASCGQDCTVVIWTKGAGADARWTPRPLSKFDEVVWRVSWSPSGNTLSVACGDNTVSLWRESPDSHEWERVQVLQEPQAAGASASSLSPAAELK